MVGGGRTSSTWTVEYTGVPPVSGPGAVRGDHPPLGIDAPEPVVTRGVDAHEVERPSEAHEAIGGAVPGRFERSLRTGPRPRTIRRPDVALVQAFAVRGVALSR